MVADVIGEVMQDPARLRHARGRDDHRRAVERVELLRVGHVAHVAHQRKVEGREALLDELLAVVEHLGVEAEHLGGADRQRAVHIDGNFRELPATPELVQCVDQFLHPAHGEGGDEDLAAARGDRAHHLAQALLGVGHALVIPVGVGGLDDQRVDRAPTAARGRG